MYKEFDCKANIYKIFCYDSLTSTNDKAMELAGNNCDDGTVIVADFQSKGRGQRQNVWESEKGLNLTFSLVLRPEFLKAHNQFLLSKIASLAVCDYLESIGVMAKIKWPNDIYIDDDKVCGMLIESSLMGENISFSIVGIGINLNQAEFSKALANPVSVYKKTGRKTDITQALDGFLLCFDEWYKTLKNENFKIIDESYFNKLYRLSGLHIYEANGRAFKARITGISAIGELILEEENGNTSHYAFKEVSYLVR